VLAGQFHCDMSGLSSRRVQLEGVTGLAGNVHRLLARSNSVSAASMPGCVSRLSVCL
jgi:hypothetical protein